MPEQQNNELEDKLDDILLIAQGCIDDEEIKMAYRTEAIKDILEVFEAYTTKRVLEGQKELLDKTYDVAPDKQFGKWKPADAVDFFNDLGIISREVTNKLKEMS